MLKIAIYGDLCANGTAQIGQLVVNDSVVNLNPFAAFSQHTGLIKRGEMLRHIWLCGVNLAEQIGDIFLSIAQATDDFQAHRC